MTKKCTKCKQDKSVLKEFYKAKQSTDGYNYWCKACVAESYERLKNKNPEEYYSKRREYRRKSRFKLSPEVRSIMDRKESLSYRYGITLEEYNRLIIKQDGKCLICKGIPKQLCVDHCHQTKKIRGLLCHSCNLTLGLVKEDPVILNAAIDYLKI